jgi:xanthine dehydrogenase/oxidase
VVAIYSLFANNSSQKYIEEHLDGNLCRCTGYRPIWDAARSLCTDNHEDGITTGPCGTACKECPERESCEMECNVQDKAEEKKETEATMCCSGTADKISKYKGSSAKDDANAKVWLDQPSNLFPDALMSPPTSPLLVVDRSFHKAGTWFKPTSLSEFLVLKREFKAECKVVVGNTEVGIETKFKHSVFPRIISPSPSITAIFSISEEEDHLRIGACVPLSMIQHKCSELLDGEFHRVAKPIHDMLRWFASTQIRNVACLGGNLATASPISDMNPMLACMNAKLVIASCDERGEVVRRFVAVSEFFLSYRTVNLKPEEIVEAIIVPKAKPILEYVFPYKQARRREDDISIVTSGMRIILEPDESSYKISEVSLAFGGMAPTTVMAKGTEDFLIGKTFSSDVFISARTVLQKELDLPDDVPGGQAQYRKALASSFLHKFYHNVAASLGNDLATISQKQIDFLGSNNIPSAPAIAESDVGALDSFVDDDKPSTCGTQTFPQPKSYSGLESKGQKKAMAAKVVNSNKDKVGQPSTHASGPLHCTGEALYTDDVPLPPGSLHASLIMASTCNVELLSIDPSVALETPGVVAVYTHEDILKLGGDNTLGPVVHDECVFLPVGERVQFIGQVIGVCIGETLECSETGARSVDIKYGEMITKPIVSIEDAIEANSFYEFARHEMHRSEDISVGEGDKIVTVNGSFRCGGQEHFYLETNSTLAIPNESATNLTVYASTQAVTKTQMYCASATNTPASKVVVRMKRMVGRVIFFLHALSLSISMINFNLFFDRAVGSEVKKPEVCLYLARRQLQQS